MQNVLVLTSTFPRWKDDTTPSFVYSLSNHLGKEYKVTVLAPHAKGAALFEKLGNLDVFRFKYFFEKHQKVAYGAGIIPNIRKSALAKLQIPLFFLFGLKMADKLARERKIGLVHAHWMIPQGIIGVYLKKKYNIPLVVTIHGSDLFPLKNRIFRTLQEHVLRNADAITVNSSAAKHEAIKRFHSLSGKVSIIPMGIDSKLFFRKSSSKLKTQYSKYKVILFAGRLNEQKGIEYLIAALPKIKSKVPSARLVIIGEGEHREKLMQLCKSLGLLESIEFLGPKTQKELSFYYSMADAFVLPAVTSKIGTESFGLVLVEAMACGACVVGSDSGGITDIIQNGLNGLLARERDTDDLADKIIQILSNKKLAMKLSGNAAVSAKKYEWKNIAKKFDSIYVGEK